MAERTEFELPSIGSVRNHVTNATVDFIYPGGRENNVCVSLSPLRLRMKDD